MDSKEMQTAIDTAKKLYKEFSTYKKALFFKNPWGLWPKSIVKTLTKKGHIIGYSFDIYGALIIIRTFAGEVTAIREDQIKGINPFLFSKGISFEGMRFYKDLYFSDLEEIMPPEEMATFDTWSQKAKDDAFHLLGQCHA